MRGLAVAAPQWGVNGHPFTQSPYFDVSIDDQLSLLTELGAGWYRVDLEANGFRAETARVDELVAKAAQRGIHVLPVLLSAPSCRSEGATPAEIRQSAFDFGKAVATRYRGKVTHWELENELDIVAMVRKGETTRDHRLWNWDGDPEGASANDYEETRYQRARAEIAGLYAGIKEADPSAETIVDTSGWLHTGFIERLVAEDHVPFDILAWHWYSEMGSITAVDGSIDLLAKLVAYGKPVWITETSRRSGSGGGKEAELAQYVSSDVAAMGRNPRIGAVMVYELLDEPYPGDDTRYGLVSIAQDGQHRWVIGQRKAAFTALHKVIEDSETVPPTPSPLTPTARSGGRISTPSR